MVGGDRIYSIREAACAPAPTDWQALNSIFEFKFDKKRFKGRAAAHPSAGERWAGSPAVGQQGTIQKQSFKASYCSGERTGAVGTCVRGRAELNLEPEPELDQELEPPSTTVPPPSAAPPPPSTASSPPNLPLFPVRYERAELNLEPKPELNPEPEPPSPALLPISAGTPSPSTASPPSNPPLFPVYTPPLSPHPIRPRLPPLLPPLPERPGLRRAACIPREPSQDAGPQDAPDEQGEGGHDEHKDEDPVEPGREDPVGLGGEDPVELGREDPVEPHEAILVNKPAEARASRGPTRRRQRAVPSRHHRPLPHRRRRAPAARREAGQGLGIILKALMLIMWGLLVAYLLPQARADVVAGAPAAAVGGRVNAHPPAGPAGHAYGYSTPTFLGTYDHHSSCKIVETAKWHAPGDDVPKLQADAVLPATVNVTQATVNMSPAAVNVTQAAVNVPPAVGLHPRHSFSNMVKTAKQHTPDDNVTKLPADAVPPATIHVTQAVVNVPPAAGLHPQGSAKTAQGTAHGTRTIPAVETGTQGDHALPVPVRHPTGAKLANRARSGWSGSASPSSPTPTSSTAGGM